MVRYKAGDILHAFLYDTPFDRGLDLAKTARQVPGNTALVFLRYYGCRLCQYDMRQFAENYPLIAETGGQLLVVLQSDPVALRQQTDPGELPYELVCDPEQRLYRGLGIAPAPSKEALGDERTDKKLRIIEQSGLQHGLYEGNELQLPAVFVMTPHLSLTHVHYGVSAGDVPTPEELAALLRQR
nr:redoxin domain-containing protein [uncultured Oscillibacter sp.]